VMFLGFLCHAVRVTKDTTAQDQLRHQHQTTLPQGISAQQATSAQQAPVYLLHVPLEPTTPRQAADLSMTVKYVHRSTTVMDMD
jgi:hypothetical protein